MQKDSEMKALSLEDEELAGYEAALNDETLKAMEAALDAVEAEQQKEAEEKSVEMILLEHVRSINQKQERVVSIKRLKLSPPEGIDKTQINQLLAELSDNKELLCLGVISLSKDSYLYDKNLMTDHFAHVQALIEDKDILTTIAEITRHDCKVYPRPVKMSTLMLPPFRYTMDEIEGALARMKFTEGFDDIDTVAASNGNLCIYSKKHLSSKYARSLAEYIEVEQPRDC